MYFFLKNPNKDWKKVKIIAFDAPHVGDKPYIERLSLLERSIPKNHPILSVVSFIQCRDKLHFEEYFKKNCEFSEGVILRDPNAWYFSVDSFFQKNYFVESTVMQLGSGKFKWPTGEITNLPISISGYSNSPFIVIRYPANNIEKSYFVSPIEATTDLFTDFFHYYISSPRPGVQCRGCGHVLDPDGLCIKTRFIYNSTYVPISFCLILQCLKSGLQRYHYANNAHKPFNNVIWVYKKDLKEFNDILPEIKWEIIPSSIMIPKHY